MKDEELISGLQKGYDSMKSLAIKRWNKMHEQKCLIDQLKSHIEELKQNKNSISYQDGYDKGYNACRDDRQEEVDDLRGTIMRQNHQLRKLEADKKSLMAKVDECFGIRMKAKKLERDLKEANEQLRQATLHADVMEGRLADIHARSK